MDKDLHEQKNVRHISVRKALYSSDMGEISKSLNFNFGKFPGWLSVRLFINLCVPPVLDGNFNIIIIDKVFSVKNKRRYKFSFTKTAVPLNDCIWNEASLWHTGLLWHTKNPKYMGSNDWHRQQLSKCQIWHEPLIYVHCTQYKCLFLFVFASNAVDRGFESQSGQTKDYKIGICCFSAKHAALRRKSKDWLAQNLDIVSEWGTCLFTDCCFSELAL